MEDYIVHVYYILWIAINVFFNISRAYIVSTHLSN